MRKNNRACLGYLTCVNLIAIIFVLGFASLGHAQFTEDTITISGTEDLVIPMGRYRIGNAIRIEAQIAGGWAQDGGVYHIVGDWNHPAKVLYRGESSISSRLTFYGYVDPNSNGYMFLFATWDNKSSSKNTARFRITSAGTFDTTNIGDFNSAQELSNILVVQSNTENIGIGTTSPSSKLTVNGTAKAKEVIVEENVGADFVFEEDYPLPDLTELEAFLQSKKHLPEIPSAEQMKRDGVKGRGATDETLAED